MRYSGQLAGDNRSCPSTLPLTGHSISSACCRKWRECLCFEYLRGNLNRMESQSQISWPYAIPCIGLAESPLQREALAARVFYLDRNAAAPAVSYLDIDSAMQEPIPRVLRHNRRAVEKILATRVFHSRCYHSASMLFHTLCPDLSAGYRA